MASLLALSRAASEEAKVQYKRKWRAHLGTLACAIPALFLSAPAAYFLGLAALGLEVTAWIFRDRGQSVNALAEEGRRAAMIVDSLGEVVRKIDLTDIHGRLSQKFDERSHKWEDGRYFASTKALGLTRFRDNLQETTFWSKHLYSRAAAKSFLASAAVVGAIIVLLLVLLPLSLRNSALDIARVLVLVIMFFIATDEFGQAVAWKAASEKLGLLDQRMEDETSSIEECLVVFGDYSAITATTPPIPTKIYLSQKQTLERLWKQRAR